MESVDLQCDESLLTGESLPVKKRALLSTEDVVEPQRAMVFAGATVTRGRARGIARATGAETEIGRIAKEVGRRSISQPPLIISMEHFARMIALAVGIAIAILVVMGFLRDMGFHDLFMLSVGLAVSAIPEGLPVAADHARHLYAIGATDVVLETIEASLQLSEAAIVGLGVATGAAIASIHEKRDEFRRALQQAARSAGREDSHSVRSKTHKSS